MQGIKVINILKTFSPGEMKEFEKFVSSPYHNRGKNPASLFEQLRKFYPEFESSEITYEYLHKKMYPGRKFNRQVMWNLSSALEKMALKFLEYESLRKHDFQRNELLLFELGERKLLGNFSNTVSDMEKFLDGHGIDYYFFDFKGRLQDFKIEYYQMLDKRHLLPEFTLGSIEFQIMLSLRMIVGGMIDMEGYRRNFNHTFETDIPMQFAKHLDLEKIVKYAYEHNFNYSFLLDIYYRTLKMIMEPSDDKNFYKTKELYEKNYDKFTMREKRNLMIWILDYCEVKSYTEPEKYNRIIFELNKFRLKEGLAFYPKGQIPKLLYLRILSIALTLGEISWARDFVRDYSMKLQTELRHSVNAMANALILFQTRSFDEALGLLKDFEFFDTRDKLFSRSIISRIYYELGEFEVLLSYIDTSRHFLKNKSVSEIYKSSFGNFLNFLAKLISLRERFDSFVLSQLQEEIQGTVELNDRLWLLEKTKEFEETPPVLT